MPAARNHGRLDVLHRLPPADRGLYQGIDVLHAKAGAVDAEIAHGFRQCRRYISRVELERRRAAPFGIAAAIEAEFATIRHVQIDRNGFARVDVTEPTSLVGGGDIGRELGRRWIGRISRHLKSGVAADDVAHSSVLFPQPGPPERLNQNGRRFAEDCSDNCFGRVCMSPQASTAAKTTNIATTPTETSNESIGMGRPPMMKETCPRTFIPALT